jgi:transcriptional regulator with XRE-family HTH domain
MTDVELGRRVAAEREARGYSQGVLADLCGVTSATVSRWESGDRAISIARLLDIGDALDVPASRLLAPDWSAVPA